MTLVRNLVSLSLQYNIMLKAEHIPGKINSIADALSRSDWQRFKTLCPEADPEPTEIPDHLNNSYHCLVINIKNNSFIF
jgi:hypothetical protein